MAAIDTIRIFLTRPPSLAGNSRSAIANPGKDFVGQQEPHSRLLHFRAPTINCRYPITQLQIS